MTKKFEGKNDEYLEVIDLTTSNSQCLQQAGTSELSLVWFTQDENHLIIDTVNYTFHKNEIISLTEFHQIEVKHINEAKLLRWNRDLYCIVDHDSEVSCKGILYYGATTVPLIKPSSRDLHILNTALSMLIIEIDSRDNLQLEMLQMMLKRILILCTRIYKISQESAPIQARSVDVIREYNFLVEKHFRQNHSVSAYAEMLNKSPKTLSNLFKKYGEVSPLIFIHNRILLEAKRMLSYTDSPVSQIGFDLGFPDVQTFSRFFKKLQGCSPQHFRTREILTTQKGN